MTATFMCPRCAHETRLPSDVAAGYCPRCRWWTGDSLLGSEDVIRQAEIDGPLDGIGALSSVTIAADPQRAIDAIRAVSAAAREMGRSFAEVADQMRLVGQALVKLRAIAATRPKPRARPWKIPR